MSKKVNDQSGSANSRSDRAFYDEPIKAVRLRHPWRIISAGLIVIWVIAFITDAAGREAYDWSAYREYVFDPRILKATVITLQLTAYSMLIAITLGVILAVLRQSPNPVFKAVSWIFIWIFRGTPVYVQLVFWGLLSTIYPTLFFGAPFGGPGFSIDISQSSSLFWIAVVGLGLNEAAYMAEIVRAGLLSVDNGQEEAAKALGMKWWATMRHIIIPQAMRIIIPPTGNEIISMLKTTSLVTAVPVSSDLYTRSRDISAETFNPIPMLLIASTWYLLITTILMVAQYFLEKRFARGHAQIAYGSEPKIIGEGA
jgi:polar amino acid transport system permease protein